MSSPDTVRSQSAGLSLRDGYELYGARVRNRLVIGLILVGTGLLVSALWQRFPHDSLAHKLLVWVTAVCFGAAEFTWAWARLLWRSWVRRRPFTTTRLRFEMAVAVLLALLVGMYILERLKW